MRFILGSLFLSIICDFVGLYYAIKYHNNLTVNDFYTLTSTIVYGSAFYFYEEFNKTFKRLILIVGIFTISIMTFFLLRDGIGIMDSKPEIVSYIYIILLCILYFIHKVFFTNKFDILNHTFFYFVSGLFMHFLTNFTFVVSFAFFENKVLWGVNSIMTFIYNLIVAYSFKVYSKHKISL